MQWRGSWTCIICGRKMKDRRAVRRVEENGETYDACVACWQGSKLSKARTIVGKQEWARRFYGRFTPPAPGTVLIVNRDGTCGLDWEKNHQ